MGATPLALIVLENQGNYTNPIHQRTTSPQGVRALYVLHFLHLKLKATCALEQGLFLYLDFNISTWLTDE